MGTPISASECGHGARSRAFQPCHGPSGSQHSPSVYGRRTFGHGSRKTFTLSRSCTLTATTLSPTCFWCWNTLGEIGAGGNEADNDSMRELIAGFDELREGGGCPSCPFCGPP